MKMQTHSLLPNILRASRFAAVVALAAIGVAAEATVKLPALLTDGVVLQRNADVLLWGRAKPNARVSVKCSWGNKTYATEAEKDGEFAIAVQTPEGSFKPYTITVSDPDGRVVINRVLVGEVWLAGGQSNMEMPLKGFAGCVVDGGLDEAIHAGGVDGVRMFTVARKQSRKPEADCEGRWVGTEDYEEVMEFSATAWHFAKNLRMALRMPVGVVVAAYGGSAIESWLPEAILVNYSDVDLSKSAIEKHTEWDRPMVMYNAMFMPVSQFTYRGIIFYQGCTNVGRHQTYAKRLADLARQWRSDIGQGDIPFFYVEIAPYQYGGGQAGKAALLREAQAKARETIPNCCIVGTNNTVPPHERHNIHPSDKKSVGIRLCWAALAKTYGSKKVVADGPEYGGKWEAKGAEAWVSLKNLGMGVCRNYDIRGFEVAGEDRVFHPADSVWLNWRTNQVVVSSHKVEKPAAVRYCFRDFLPGTLHGANNLPCLPFRTDDWEE